MCQLDNVLIHGGSEEEHDTRLEAALERVEKAGVTLNREIIMCLQNEKTQIPGSCDR